MVSLVIRITICIISLSIMSRLRETTSTPPPRRTSMEPPHSQFPPRKLGPLDGSMPINTDVSSMSEEKHRRNIVDSTGDGYASQDKKAMTRRMLMMTAPIHLKTGKEENKRRGTRMALALSNNNNNNNTKSGRYYNKYYFTMDYSGVRRRRPIHNKSQPSSSSLESELSHTLEKEMGAQSVVFQTANEEIP